MSASDRGRFVACGSLPYRNVNAAVRAALAADVPFVPTLPRLAMSERIDRQRLSTESFRAWPAFRAALGGRKLPVLKVQIPGPVTSPAAWRDDPGELLKAFQAVSRELWVFLDEPVGLRSAPQQATLARAVRRLRGAGRRVGVHCCGETDWHRIFATKPDFVSFDAGLSWASVVAAMPNAFAQGGGRLVVGVPTGWRKRLEPAVAPARLCWSTACGLAYASLAEARRAERRVLRYRDYSFRTSSTVNRR